MNPVFKTYIKYVSANVLGMIGLSCYILADTFFIARGIGADGLAALNLAIPVYNFFNGLGLMVGMGGATRYSISKGNGDHNARQEIFTHAFYFALLIASVFVIPGIFFPEQIARILGADSSILPMTASYLRILMVFTPLFMSNNLMICFVRNDGAPNLSMTAMLLGSFSNILLDYIFIFPMNMGMQGAALATAAAPLISLSILSSHIWRKKNQFHFHRVLPSLRRLADISALGSSSLIVEVSSGIVMIIFNLLILKLSGNLGVAAYGIIANIALVLTSIYTGISQGIQPIISQSYGQKKYRDIKSVLYCAIATSIVISAISYAVMYFESGPIVSLFNKEQDLQLALIAENGMHLYFTALLFIGLNIITAAYLSSVEQPKQAFILSSLRGFLLVIPTAFLLAHFFGITGVWLTLPVTELLVMFPAVFFIRRSLLTFSNN